MPPRKRTQSTPNTEAEPTAEQLTDDTGADTLAPAVEETPAPPADTKPKRGERKPTNLPCADCFPNGWPETSTGLGCEHGSWTRD